jgi:hypothetical protein
VSAVLWPIDEPPPELAVLPVLPPASSSILWGDWSRRQTRREWITLLRTQTVKLTILSAASLAASTASDSFTRQQRAHYRLSWAQRLARNATSSALPSVSITLFGIPDAFAKEIGSKAL